MNLEKASELATSLQQANQSKPGGERPRYSVEMLPSGDYRVVARDPQTFEDREVAR
jgi:hypothetical protein